MKKRWILKKGLVGILLIVPILVFLCSGTAHADRWANAYGGAQSDQAYSVLQTSDGGFLVAGMTDSFGVSDTDAWFLKLDANGGVEWEYTYGGEGSYIAHSVQQTPDGGFIVAGETDASGSADMWLLKLNSNGTLGWQNTYGGIGTDRAYSVQQISGGGFILAGETNSSGAGESDFWVLKLNKNGNVGTSFLGTWQKTYGGYGPDRAYSVQQTSDGGFIVAGEKTDADDYSNIDAWVLKLNKNGSVNWEKTYDVNDLDQVYSIRQTSDGGYVMAGMTGTVNGTNSSILGSDVWVLKLDSDGIVDWENAYDLNEGDMAFSIRQTSDDKYVVAGATGTIEPENWSNWVETSGTGTYNETQFPPELYRTGYPPFFPQSGTITEDWTLTFTSSTDFSVTGATVGLVGTCNIHLGNCQPVNGESFYFSIEGCESPKPPCTDGWGGTWNAGDTITFTTTQWNWDTDVWVLKLDSDGDIASGGTSQKTYGGDGDDLAYSVQQISEGGYIVAGMTDSFGAGSDDFFVLKLNKNVEIPDCEAMATSDATPVSTSATITDTDALISSTTVNNKKGLALPADSGEAVDEVCSYEEPDLVVSFLNAPVSVSKGATIDIEDRTANIGSAGAGATTTKFYFSNDNILDGTDTLLDSRSVDSLGAGEINPPLEIAGEPNPPATTSVTIPNKPAGNYYIIAKADADDPEDVIESLENNNTAAKAITLMNVTLLTPNGGEAIQSGGFWGVCWKAPVIAKKFTLEYTTDYTADPVIWTPIKTVTGLNCTTWDVPVVSANKKQCKVRVTGKDSADVQVGTDMSDKPFTIEVVRVLSPNGGETLQAGTTTWNIKWLTNKTIAPVTQTVLEYTVNNGALWKPIATLEGNPVPGSHTFAWTVPDEDSATCKVRVTLKRSGGTNIGTDISNKVFKILPLP